MWGFAMQFTMAIIVLRWSSGFKAVQWMSDQIVTFINYSMDGTGMVFGDPWQVIHNYAFVVGTTLDIPFHIFSR